MRLSIEQRGRTRFLHLDDITIFFESSIELPTLKLFDGFACAVIAHAMKAGQPLYVGGPMSRDALLNLRAFQEAWSCWRPETYHQIDIVPSEIVDSVPPGHQAIVAFSGGVDSVFTALRHSKKLLRESSFPVRAVLLVHGFDVPLSNPGHFEKLKERVSPLLKNLNLELITMRTNIKELWIQDWHDSFIAQLASCMHNFSHRFRYALTGSAEPYNALILPWGQNPCTDHLLSGSDMAIVHDGAGFSRTEKVALIATDALASKTIKVCWEGKDTYENCGVCEKCIRTRLNFAAVGITNPECFDDRLTVAHIRSLKAHQPTQLNELRLILEYAKKRNIAEPWNKALKAKLRRARQNLIHGEVDEIFAKLTNRLSES